MVQPMCVFRIYWEANLTHNLLLHKKYLWSNGTSHVSPVMLLHIALQTPRDRIDSTIGAVKRLGLLCERRYPGERGVVKYKSWYHYNDQAYAMAYVSSIHVADRSRSTAHLRNTAHLTQWKRRRRVTLPAAEDFVKRGWAHVSQISRFSSYSSSTPRRVVWRNLSRTDGRTFRAVVE
jgi:hypothetical protein